MKMAFRKKVFGIVRGIPKGSTMSYGEVAKRAGRPGAGRAVGAIMKTNWDPAIPCHRVVGSGGSLGGYNRGAWQKVLRLADEGALVGKPLKADFFARPTLTVAKELLGKVLVRKIGSKKMQGIITEVEAYDGLEDKASHAHRGKTERNAVMFGPAGYWYVYFVYGMHWMANIVTARDGYPAAVLLRATHNASGPAKLTKKFRVDRRNNKRVVAPASALWIEDIGLRVSRGMIKKSPRIGVSYAGASASKPWRLTFLPGAVPGTD